MQWTDKNRTEIQDAQKSITIQNIQRTELFNNIEDEWEQSYFMEDDLTGKEDTPSTAAEVDKIHAWNEGIADDPMEMEMLAEANEVYHKYGRYPTQHRYWTPGPRLQKFRAPFRGGQGNQRPFTLRYNNPRHLNTTVANQAYTFNSTTPHTSINYAPGTFNMGAPFSTYQQVPYNHQRNQLHTQNQQYHNNSFAEKQNNVTSQSDTTALVEKLQELLLMHKNLAHQVNEVQVATPKPSTMWGLKAAT